MVDGMDFVDDVDIETTTCEVVPIPSTASIPSMRVS
jgi:hypothetical protein